MMKEISKTKKWLSYFLFFGFIFSLSMLLSNLIIKPFMIDMLKFSIISLAGSTIIAFKLCISYYTPL